MKQLDQLPQIAERALGGLQADSELKNSIQTRYLEKQKRHHQMIVLTKAAAPALCALLVLSLIFFPSAPSNTITPPSITTLPLGETQTHGTGEVQLLGEVAVSSGRQSSGETGIWASSSSSFPLIGLDGRYYRLLSSPNPLSASSRGNSLGKVEEYTTEPSLSDTDIVSSNCVYAGQDVYSIPGLENTFVCSNVDGVLRLFHRVSFNGHSTVGRESLGDTLQLSGHIRSISLSGIGTVTDSATAENLFKTLIQTASYQSSGSINATSVLTITLNEGFSAQMLVADDRLAACGVWSCPEFIEAFQDAVK